ncbi:MAG: (E)-4-hydroxy-3-methylbut-2-enyl-diphosphate synthase [Prolixibacteraceae bacterium]|jgi:(E)-4-hydroxy-3-methylbut-2-enyl-diphosphate synthase|nr:(E)-4-hydroxy-3-methylbut-2-enyl-diphosphate synthase [Bacteroidota bacterium]NLS99740.1 (E)-4-hydroxy-3-methylbut-2-enyl-diphosphate synthase [Bacteroidales bacterium]OQB81797.1 MAG: 4-hydroxy-3-methylbut-2-en-1-yl diphosphate synthase [Bacteroidetes bacterium ADurb.Bin123]HNZ67804.1 (E)-4-hydroxy-3-methylbut-2-enyl-diphosphate synthase [Prolixibacteraceae bacterium]HOC85372.1 (E)-4-hydroxy-3-methylbut-2-enyl-diphosphate synthase [Prolixibacteraceae bacterium]
MHNPNFKYINDLCRFERLKTREVQVGSIPIGGGNPIRIQSMTDTDTRDTEATVSQIIRIIKAGADYVRVTVKGLRDAENLKDIKKELDDLGFNTPLIADIHFNPKLAEIAARHISKVRINPGNFYDKRAQFEHHIYTDEQYREELQKIEELFIPFLELLRKRNTALRIGANHGSLSDRIMSRYGDTSTGIVESVMEFLRICKKADFHDVVISIKSSNTRMMVYTVRLLCFKMRLEEMDYPLHLGVTEAGEGEEGRIRSAVGIGALLADGIGDTIRVSLTESPEMEIPVARKLIDHFKSYQDHPKITAPLHAQTNPFEYERRSTRPVMNMGGRFLPVVIADLGERSLQEVLPIRGKLIPDYFLSGNKVIDIQGNANPVISLEEYLFESTRWGRMKFIRTNKMEFDKFMDHHPEIITKLKQTRKTVLILESFNKNPFAELRAFFMMLETHIWKVPVIIFRSYSERKLEDLQIKASADLGGLLIDGYGDGICISNDHENITFTELKDLSFGILQSSRMRVSRTEFISCPGCGRTQFDLHETTRRVKEHFGHLNHLKIGIMGCIVNGPGEMGDVDYGFVGSGNGKVSLYKGLQVVKRSIPFENAVEELEQMIRENGDWADV